jgi:RNA polymerase sigma-70 factor (ECF subfamily)
MNNDEYARIVKLYYEDIKKVSFALCKNLYDAEDVTQTTFIKLLNQKEEFDDDYHIKRWLIKVAINECRMLWKSPWKTKVDYYVPEKAVNHRGMDDEELLVLDAVMKLKKKYREIVHLFYYEEYSAKEIAEILDLNEGTVFKRLQRAREQIKAYMVKRKGS